MQIQTQLYLHFFTLISFALLVDGGGHPRRIRFTNTTKISLGLAWWRDHIIKKKVTYISEE
jgi:hypothetical protein